MKEFSEGQQYPQELKALFEDRRPTKEELDNFVVTPEIWQKALEEYRKGRDDLIRAAAFSRDRAISSRF